MRTQLLAVVGLIAAGCASARPLPRAPLVPPLPQADPRVERVERAERREGGARAPTRTESDRSPPTTSERPEYLPPSQPVYRTVVHTVEVERADAVPQYDASAYPDPGYATSSSQPSYYQPSYYQPYYGSYYGYGGYGSYGGAYYGYGAPWRSRGPGFPINTALGAGIGAIIGNQSGRSGRGALIGGGVGLLLDLPRLFR